MTQDDPHADLHQHAAQDTHHDDPAPVQDADWKTELDKLNKTLTKRINDLRTDVDNFKSAVSKSVNALANDVNSAKTAIQNNKDAIEAQDGLIEEAKTAAANAKTAADEATKKANQVETGLGDLEHRYEQHDHGVTVTFAGRTGPPDEGGAGQ